MSYERLKGLTAQDFEHPGEKAAMAALRKIPLLDMVMAKYLDMEIQMGLYAQTAGSNFRVTKKTNPRLYGLYQQALERLDMPEEYPLYCNLDFQYNAFASGVDNPFIVVNSSTVANFSDGEMLHLLGHELGHIKCKHLVYYNLARSLNGILAGFGDIGAVASVGLQYAIMEWERNKEYSADRAGLIASGDIEASTRQTMKLLGQSDKIPYIDFSVEEVMKQVDDFAVETSDVIGKMMYVAYTARQTHPWSILRLKQIREWHDSGEYGKVINQFR